MKTFRLRIIEYTSYFFILLFCYAGVSKILDFENFQIQIAQSPLLSAYAGLISFAVIVVEMIISLMLLFNRTRIIGLYASTALMTAFTLYIYLILNYSDFIPCSCGGILEKMSWTQHLIFNTGCVIAGTVAVVLAENEKTAIKTAFALAITNIAAGVLVVALFFSSEHIIKKENNFTRRFLIHPVIEEKRMDLKVNSYYFAGEHAGKIYLGSYTSPFTLSMISENFSRFEQYQLIPPGNNIRVQNTKMVVRHPYIYLADGRVPVIYRTLLGTRHLSVYSYKDVYFNDYAVPDSATITFRVKNAKGDRHIAGILVKGDRPQVRINSNAFQSDHEGVFSTDGRLIDNRQGKIIFVYYYKNTFSVSSPEFSEIRYYKTIDTISSAKLTVVRKKNGHMKMAAPPVMVNKNAAAFGNVLFNHSNLKGKFESRKLWQTASVVDMYRTDRQEYLGSFYVGNRNHSKMSQMLATEKYFYTITENEIVRYRYAQSVSKHFHTGKAENLKRE